MVDHSLEPKCDMVNRNELVNRLWAIHSTASDFRRPHQRWRNDPPFIKSKKEKPGRLYTSVYRAGRRE